jgi:cell division inhibitor SepF
MQQEEIYDENGEYDERQGFWSRMREKMFGPDPTAEEEEEPQLAAVGRPAIRLHSARIVHIDVRKSAFNLDDARLAADGLKSGKQQVVNLERTAPQTADRLVDFLSGVTYALDGTVEPISDRVFLFAPANVQIDSDEDGTGSSESPESAAAWAR